MPRLLVKSIWWKGMEMRICRAHGVTAPLLPRTSVAPHAVESSADRPGRSEIADKRTIDMVDMETERPIEAESWAIAGIHI